MTDKELWNEYLASIEEKSLEMQYESWAFGCNPDELAKLVLDGIKTATASAYAMYEYENEEIPKEGSYNVILNSKEEAICIIKTTKVYIEEFKKVSADHAYKEGEGDRSLAYWRKVHQEFFTECLKEIGMEFGEDMKVVCEEFEVIFRKTRRIN